MLGKHEWAGAARAGLGGAVHRRLGGGRVRASGVSVPGQISPGSHRARRVLLASS